MLRSRQIRAHAGGRDDDLLEGKGMDYTNPKARKPDCMKSEPRSKSGGAGFFRFLGFSCHLVLSAVEVH